MTAKRLEDSWEYNMLRALTLACGGGGKPAVFASRRSGTWKYFVLMGERSKQKARALGPRRR